LRYILKFILLLLLFFQVTPASSEQSYVFLVTIDGLRPDAISEKNTPNLTALLLKSSYTLNASTVFPSYTMPSHASLFTGLDVKNHKTTLNDHNKIDKLLNQNKYLPIDTIFTWGVQKNLRTTFICGKDKLRFLIKPDAKNTISCYDIYWQRDNIIQNITQTVYSTFKSTRNNINFIHYPEPDLSGHINGWMSTKYIESLKKVDSEIQKLTELIQDEMLDKNYLLIITSDHGGTGNSHGSKIKEHMTIPWIAHGNSVKKNHKIKRKIKIYDTAPTILHFLNIEIPDNLDGEAITEIFN
jgi:predicted AlkP superfamily pyrophosphatase or phosphodiesterase